MPLNATASPAGKRVAAAPLGPSNPYSALSQLAVFSLGVDISMDSSKLQQLTQIEMKGLSDIIATVFAPPSTRVES